MKFNATIPVEVTVDYYKPRVPGYFSGPFENCYPDEPSEIEFTICTLSGIELSKDDFTDDGWSDLCSDILNYIEAEREEARADLQISNYEYQYLDD